VSEGRGAVAEQRASFATLCADERAFTAWYELALPRVYGFVLGRVGGEVALAEEISSSAFLDAVRARHSFDGRSDPVTWICSIARNRLLDHYRREARDQLRHLRLIVTDLSANAVTEWERSGGIEGRIAREVIAGPSAPDRRAISPPSGALRGRVRVRSGGGSDR
jgi:RNA polymerase sigma-70 factor (ECF subfamily)